MPQIRALVPVGNWSKVRGTAPTPRRRGCSEIRGEGGEKRACHLPPVEAMPSINCFWKMRYRTTMGSMASREPAISTGKLVLN